MGEKNSLLPLGMKDGAVSQARDSVIYGFMKGL